MDASVRLLHSVLPTSVSLQVKVPSSHPSVPILGTERIGSGTLIDEGGIALTVNYIVMGAEKIEATLHDGTKLRAEVIARDFHSGLAAVRIPGAPHVAASGFDSQALCLGQDVFLLASIGDTGRRVNNGAIFSVKPFEAFWEYQIDRGILTTAMNPGLGGGGLFTMRGELTGVVSLDLADVGRFTLAIPVEYFFEHQGELLRHGRRVTRPPRAWVGLYCYALRGHIVVAGVLPGTPGDDAGLKPGDVILSVGDAQVGERRTLYSEFWKHKPGEVIHLRIFRSDATLGISVRAADAETFFA